MSTVRTAVPGPVWGAAVQLARAGAVARVNDDGEEIELRVKQRGKALPFEVFLWPDDEDAGCNCGLPEPCVHVCAAVIAVKRELLSQEAEELVQVQRVPPPSGKVPSPAGEVTRGSTSATKLRAPAAPVPRSVPGQKVARSLPEKTYKADVFYVLTSDKNALRVERQLVDAKGNHRPLNRPIAQTDVIVERHDVHIETLLALQTGPTLSADLVRRFLSFSTAKMKGTLDGKPIQFSRDPLQFRVKVRDEMEGFRVGLFRPPNIDALFRGAALKGDILRPTSHGRLTVDQRQALVKGLFFSQTDVGRLVGEYLPRLREKISVDVETKRLPGQDDLEPKIQLTLSERPEGLAFRGEIVYGNPPVARLVDGVFKVTGGVVPFRDMNAERAVSRSFERTFGKVAGYTHVLPPEEAVEFLRNKVRRHDGPVQGRVDPRRFEVVEAVVEPELFVERSTDGEGWNLDVNFSSELGEADPWSVLGAWRSGRSLVPLLDGGFAPLPLDWLKRHGPLLKELLEARDHEGRVERNATAALVELLEDTKADVPPDLAVLRNFLENDAELPQVDLSSDFAADLREYQWAGVRWLAFLDQMDLGGVLADDMGLGKTVQALAQLARVPGPHLVVAPTSVLRNWEREAARFAPGLDVNLYHGPNRKPRWGDLTLTSYALLRIDFDRLSQVEWSYVVLDEAQAIKNPSSQTARSAFKIPAKNRLCLTGTPVENRLEELWSLFRFLMPGLLGSIETFRERFVRPIEAGSQSARQALRARVKPYVLRRLKQQVATELPPLTDIVIRCEMSKEQRRVYDSVRLAARRDVQEALLQQGDRGVTIQILEALLRMRQACCDPALLPARLTDEAPSCKLDQLDEMLVDLVVDGHKALIFSQWTGLLNRVEPRLRELGIDFVRLDGGTRRRQDVIDRFQDPEGPPIFLLSLKAGGTGLNLTAADYVVHLDPWWNPAVQQQATDRAHRIGQDKPVMSVRLIAANTVEEKILELQDAKRDLAEAALGSEGGFVKALSAEELRSLFEAA